MKALALFTCVILLLSCKQNDSKPNAISDSSVQVQSKISELAERYLELGRFSGSILVADKEDIIFKQNFGYADHIKKRTFSDNPTFKTGTLSSFIIKEIFADSFDIKKETLSQDSIISLVQNFCDHQGMSSTYFNTKNEAEARGHLYINQGNGLNWNYSPSYNLDTISILEGLKSNTLDLLSFLRKTEDPLELDGYLSTDGFSYGVSKNSENIIIILSNTRHPVAKEMIASVQAILAQKKYTIPLPRVEVKVDSKLLKQYAGSYKLSPEMELKVELSGDSLFTYMGPQKLYLAPQSDNQFFIPQTDAAIRFISDKDSKVIEAEMLDGFLTGNRIKKI